MPATTGSWPSLKTPLRWVYTAAHSTSPLSIGRRADLIEDDFAQDRQMAADAPAAQPAARDPVPLGAGARFDADGRALVRGARQSAVRTATALDALPGPAR